MKCSELQAVVRLNNTTFSPKMVQPLGRVCWPQAGQEQGGGRGNEAACRLGTRFSPGAGVSNPLIQDCFLRLSNPDMLFCAPPPLHPLPQELDSPGNPQQP